MDKKETKLTKLKRFLALFGVLLLVVLYAVTLFAAITASPSTHRLFIASLALTVAIPVMIYVFLWLVKKFG